VDWGRTGYLWGQNLDNINIMAIIIVIGKQKCSENGNCNAVKTGTGIQ